MVPDLQFKKFREKKKKKKNFGHCTHKVSLTRKLIFHILIPLDVNVSRHKLTRISNLQLSWEFQND